MSSKSSSLDIDTVNRKLQEIPPITTVGGSQIQFYSIFQIRENNASDEFNLLPLQKPMEGSFLLDESHNVMKRG